MAGHSRLLHRRFAEGWRWLRCRERVCCRKTDSSGRPIHLAGIGTATRSARSGTKKYYFRSQVEFMGPTSQCEASPRSTIDLIGHLPSHARGEG